MEKKWFVENFHGLKEEIEWFCASAIQETQSIRYRCAFFPLIFSLHTAINQKATQKYFGSPFLRARFLMFVFFFSVCFVVVASIFSCVPLKILRVLLANVKNDASIAKKKKRSETSARQWAENMDLQ